MLLHLGRPVFDEGCIFGRMLRVHPSSIVMEDLYCLSVLPYYYVHTNVSVCSLSVPLYYYVHTSVSDLH